MTKGPDAAKEWTRNSERRRRGSRLRCGTLALLVAGNVVVFAPPSRGADGTASDNAPPPADRALAESLFQQGRDLMQKNALDEACPKLEESYRLDAAVGTLLNLAVCHEQQGRIALAWAEFNDAATEAKRTGQTAREELARRKAEALKPNLPMVTVQVAKRTAALPSAVVKLDGRVLGRGAWNTPIPVDPGEHRIEASADGHQRSSSAFVASAQTTSAVTVPELATEETSRPPASPPQDRGGVLRVLGLTAGAVGLAGLAVGTAVGLHAVAEKDRRDGLCVAGNVCPTREGVDADGSARSAATASTAAFVGGSVLVAAGVTLFLLAPKARRADVAVTLTPAAGKTTGIVLGGKF